MNPQHMKLVQRVFRRALLTVAGLGTAACAFGQSSWTPDQSVAGAGKTFADLRTEWASNLRDKKVDACVAEFAPDAEFVQPDGSSIRGPAAIRSLYENITTAFDSDLVFDSKQLETVGDDAIDSGDYREVLTTRPTGKRQFYTGGYKTIYHRNQDGHWLIVKMTWIGSGNPIALDFDPHPVVALTFDDLPAAGALPPAKTRSEIAESLTAELKSNHLVGTYGFVNASKLENNPDAQQSLHIWLDAGMNIGSHTWSHMSLTANTAEAFERDIAQNEPALAQYGEMRDWHWFRYPFLWEGDTVEKRRAVRSDLSAHRYRVAQVSLDFEDYAWNDAYTRCSARNDAAAIAWLKQSYIETADEYIKLGREEQQIAFGHEIPNVMLLHATAFTTLMLPNLLDYLRAQGFSFAGLAQVESDPAYAQEPDAGLKYGGTLPDQFMDSRHLPYPPFKPKPFPQLTHLCQ
jgi:peptidoglycan/xylan/chitin deacetylase (PgdA/CDA1 family)